MYCTPNATTDKLQRLLNAAERDTTYEKGRSRSEAAYVTWSSLARRAGTSEVQARVDGA